VVVVVVATVGQLAGLVGLVEAQMAGQIMELLTPAAVAVAQRSAQLATVVQVS
jgi:alkylated DNA nucleotide flippase Atl1